MRTLKNIGLICLIVVAVPVAIGLDWLVCRLERLWVVIWLRASLGYEFYWARYIRPRQRERESRELFDRIRRNGVRK